MVRLLTGGGWTGTHTSHGRRSIRERQNRFELPFQFLPRHRCGWGGVRLGKLRVSRDLGRRRRSVACGPGGLSCLSMRLLVLLGLLARLATAEFGPTLKTGDALGSDSVVHASIDLDGRHSTEAARSAPVQGDFAGIATCVNSCKALCTSTRAKCLMKAYSHGRGLSIQQLWWGAPLDKYPGYDGPLPSMLSEGDCIAHILLGASVGDPGPDVALVEMGTWLGAASVCTAAGLSLARSTVEYHAFDLFSMPPPSIGRTQTFTSCTSPGTCHP